jgi:lauroyl/myristoyl acyltransferase
MNSKEKYHRWVSVSNIDLIKAAQEQGRGVLLTACHIGMGRFLPLAMAREGFDIVTLEADAYYRKLNLPHAERYKSLEMRDSDGFFLKVLFQAKKHLKNAGVVLMAPDGKQGMGEGAGYSFLGSERNFYAGFGALAEQTKAVVIWCNITVHDNGRIDVELTESPQPSGSSPDEKADSLVRQYVAFVEEIWKTGIAKVNGRHIADYLSQNALQQ